MITLLCIRALTKRCAVLTSVPQVAAAIEAISTTLGRGRLLIAAASRATTMTPTFEREVIGEI